MRSFHFFLSIALGLLLQAGCSGYAETPTEPVQPVIEIGQKLGNRHMWGMWDISIDTQDLSYTILHKRDAAFHLNVRTFLEDFPCKDCISIAKISLSPHESIYVDIKIRHPFPNCIKLTGFDVRGVAIFPGSRLWPGNELWTCEHEDGDAELLNPDGFTRLFNPAEYPSSVYPAILSYSHGKFANADPWITVNAFKSFYTDKNRHFFAAGAEEIARYDIKPPVNGLLLFGYAIDASWAPPAGYPDIEVPDSFPEYANCLEAYNVSATQVRELYKDGKPSIIWIDVYDRQGTKTIQLVTLEAPGVATDIKTAVLIEDNDTWARYEVLIYDEFNLHPGEFEYLVRVIDSELDKNLGQIEAFAKFKFKMNDGFELEFCEANLFVLGDGNIFCGEYGNEANNKWFMQNMIESYTGMDGEFSNNDIVKFYYGHDGHFNDYLVHIQNYINGLGYTFVESDEEPIDTTGCRMIVIYMPGYTMAAYFTPAEVADLLYFLHNGGRLAIVSDYSQGGYTSKDTLNRLLEDLGSTIHDKGGSTDAGVTWGPFPDCPAVYGLPSLNMPASTYFEYGPEDICLNTYDERCILLMTDYYS